jgi:Domain of unknown function (DUF4279)
MLSISLCFKGDTLDPEIISETLGITPSKTLRKGQTRRTQTDKEVVSQTSLWELTTHGHIDSAKFSDHLSYIKDCLGLRLTSIRTLPNLDEGFVDVFISGESENEQAGTVEFTITPQDTEFLSIMGLPVRFTAYS